MIQRQIVVKALDKQIDIEDPVLTIYLITTLYSINWILISVIVTIYRTAILHRDQNSGNWITISPNLRSIIKNYDH